MWMGFWYLFVCAVVLILIKHHWSRRKIYQLTCSLHGPPALPIFGNALMFWCKEEDIFERLVKVVNNYPSPMRIWLGPKLVVAVKTAHQIEKIFTSSSASSKDDLYRFLKVFNGDSLFTSTGNEWKRHKRLIAPSLSSKYMESYVTVARRCCRMLVEKVGEVANGELIDIDYYVYRFYQDVVHETLTGHNPGAQHGTMDAMISLCHEAYVLLHSRMTKAWLHPDFIFRKSANGKRQSYITKSLRTLLCEHIKLAPINNNDNEEFKSVYLRMLEEIEKHPEMYGNQNLMDHIVTLFSAAEDPTSTISCYLMIMLGMYPEIQDRVFKEIREVFGNGDVIERITFKDLSRMHYLGMCIKEVLRIFPIAPFIARKLVEDLDIEDNVTLPKGSTILLCLYHVQRSTEYWKMPAEFYPEHFLPESVANRHPYAFLPFSAGAHSCPGQLFAISTIKAVVISILPRFVLEADGTWKDIKIKADISIRPVDGYKLRIRRRSAHSS